LFSLFHGPINKVPINEPNKYFHINEINIDKIKSYYIYLIKKGRLYTDRVHNATVIQNNSIISGASYQYGYENNMTIKFGIEKNLVIKNGTPRKKKKIKGRVFSMLSGGAANKNYFHWMFDVLPRLALIEGKFNLRDIDFFLLPNTKEKFQKQTLSELNISSKKWLSSEKFRHIESDEILVTDHPYASENLTNDIQNIPFWISKWLKVKFISKKTVESNFKKKIYIKRTKRLMGKRREIINEEDVINLLLKKDFDIISLSELNFIDQVSLFNNANLIISLHDAGFANLPFCKEGTSILEIKPKTAGKLYENIAKTNKLNYSCINCEPELTNDKNQDGSINVNLKILKDYIRE
jgi:capsular polysaccharide biosynthesis protein